MYDNTAIVIISDHGFGDGVEGNDRQNPILFVKGIDEHHDFKVSNTKVSFEDMPKVFLRLSEGKNTEESFDGLNKETRRFIHYVYEKEDHLEEYTLNGHAWESDKLKPTGKVYDLK